MLTGGHIGKQLHGCAVWYHRAEPSSEQGPACAHASPGPVRMDHMRSPSPPDTHTYAHAHANRRTRAHAPAARRTSSPRPAARSWGSGSAPAATAARGPGRRRPRRGWRGPKAARRGTYPQTYRCMHVHGGGGHGTGRGGGTAQDVGFQLLANARAVHRQVTSM